MITSRELTHALQEVYDPQPSSAAYEAWAAAQLAPGEGIEDGADRISNIIAAELAEAKHEAESAALIVVGLVAAIVFVCVVGHIIAQAAP